METFYYPEKGWFKHVTKLNASGLIPGLTLTEQHVSKKECKQMFVYGGDQSNNGYRINAHCSFFNERLQWLWLRVHQVEKPANNDFGLAFAQSIIYEYNTGEEVDWAELAVRTVTRYSRTRGQKQVHPLWAWAHPSVTIDLQTTTSRTPFAPTTTSRTLQARYQFGIPSFPLERYVFQSLLTSCFYALHDLINA